MTVTQKSIVTTRADGSDPVWLGQLGLITGYKHTKNFPGGCTTASFSFIAPPDFTHRGIQGGRNVQVYSGAALIFAGKLSQPVPGQPWQMAVAGNATAAKDYPAAGLVAGNAAVLSNTIDGQIAAGLPWTRPAAVTNVVGVVDPYSTTLDSLLGTLVTQAGLWDVTEAGVFTTPTSPPPAGYLLFLRSAPGRTLDGFCTRVVITNWVDGSGNSHRGATYNAPAAVQAKYGITTQFLDLSNTPGLTGPQVDAIGQALVAKLAANGLAWSSTFTVRPGDLFTLTGRKVDDLSVIRARTTVRVVELNLDNGSQSGSVDVPLAEVTYEDSDTLTLTPDNSALDDFLSNLTRRFVK